MPELAVEDQEKVLIGIVQGHSVLTALGALYAASRSNRRLWKSADVARMKAVVKNYFRLHKLDGDVAEQGKSKEAMPGL